MSVSLFSVSQETRARQSRREGSVFRAAMARPAGVSIVPFPGTIPRFGRAKGVQCGPPPVPQISKAERFLLQQSLPAAHWLETRLGLRGKVDSPVNHIHRRLHPRELGVIAYGSARPQPGDPEYQLSVELGGAIGKMGFFTVTGGGPGTMRAVAEGAAEVGAHTVGSAMEFPDEETDRGVYREFVLHRRFSDRLWGRGGFERRGAYTVVLPGGTGTVREVMARAEELYFDKTLHPCQKQVVLLDHDGFYSRPGGLLSHLAYLRDTGKASQGFIDLFKVATTVEEAVEMLRNPGPDVGWTPGVNGKPVCVLPDGFEETIST